jgi:endoglucanase
VRSAVTLLLSFLLLWTAGTERVSAADAPVSAIQAAPDLSTPPLPSRLRGVNIPIHGALPNVARAVAAWGGNSIRVLINVDKGYDRNKSAIPAGQALVPYTQGIALLHAFLPVCHELGLKVIVAPWYIPGWTKNGVQASARINLTEFWKAFAQEFKGDSTIVAYDVFNEPSFPPEQDASWYKQMLPDAVATIRAINPNIWLVVEPDPWGLPIGLPHLVPLNDPHVIYSFHQYGPHEYVDQGVKNLATKGQLTYPGMLQDFRTDPVKMWDRAALMHYMQPAIDFTNKYHVRMLVGEFGVTRWAPGREKWVADGISIFEQQGWDWMFHSVAGWNGWNPTFAPEAPAAQTEEEGGVMTPELQLLIKSWALNGTKASP